MTVVDIDAVRDWLARLPGGSPAGRYADDWDAFAKLEKPVVTLFGSYDTGKSSLLRRLLVDAGSDVPAWLTISARHETFEVNDVELGGCIVRDTPGFAVGASDLRARNNSRRAMAAVGLTDVGIAVLTSQLATADRDLLRELLDRGWPAGTMWFVISRFDEAGGDPEGNLAGYRRLSDRKVQELREVFALDDRAPVFVVSQDPFQTAGQDADPYPEMWNAFREWDGMRDLAEALAAVSPSALPAWRQAAGQRYWSAVLAETTAELRTHLADYTERAEVAAHGVARRDGWQTELDQLDRAARAALDGLVDEVLRRSWEAGAGADELQRALGEWFTRHESRLERLRQSIRKSRERERARPSWDGFATLAATVEDTVSQDGTRISEHTGNVGAMLLGVLRTMTETTGGKKPSKLAERVRPHLSTAEAALPLAVYVAGLADQHLTNRARLSQDRTAAEKREQVIADCTRLAHDTWQPYVDDVRDEIIAETADQVALDASLRRLVDQLREAIAAGEALTGR